MAANNMASVDAKACRATVSKQIPVKAGEPIKLVIVDDHELLRLGLRLMLDAEPDLKVCGEATTELEGRQLVSEQMPHLVIADLSLTVGNGLELTEWISRNHPQVRTIVSTMHDERIYGERVLRAGAWGYVSKSAPAGTLVTVIRKVLAGEYCFSERLNHRALGYLRTEHTPSKSPVDRLSNRELEVLRHLGTGMTSNDIATALKLSTSTVDTYRERIKAKLNLTSAAELTHYATRWVLGQN